LPVSARSPEPPCADADGEAAPDDELGDAEAPEDGDAEAEAEAEGDAEVDADADGSGVEPPPPSESPQSVQNTLCLAAPFSPSKFQNSL